MSRKHGRARIPFGKRWKGVEVRNVPSDYLSYLTGWEGFADPQWGWLKESVIAELKFRGMVVDFVDPEPSMQIELPAPEPKIRDILI